MYVYASDYFAGREAGTRGQLESQSSSSNILKIKVPLQSNVIDDLDDYNNEEDFKVAIKKGNDYEVIFSL